LRLALEEGSLAQVRLLVGFTTAAEDDDFVLERLTAELADELRAAGEVDYMAMPARPGDKGVAEVAIATLSVLTAVDPAYLRVTPNSPSTVPPEVRWKRSSKPYKAPSKATGPDGPSCPAAGHRHVPR
jgi:hypothetical protein